MHYIFVALSSSNDVLFFGYINSKRNNENSISGLSEQDVKDWISTSKDVNDKFQKVISNPTSFKTRIIARRLDNDSCNAIVNLLAFHVFKEDLLINKFYFSDQPNFRNKNNWSHNPIVDFKYDHSGFFVNSMNSKFYCYALIDPSTNEPFYIGKGSGLRINDHFIPPFRSNNRKEAKIKGLLAKGYQPFEIGRVICKLTSEKEAFDVESFYIRYVFSMERLTNIVFGQNLNLFRNSGDFEQRYGFDIPIVIQHNNIRYELLDLFLGAGLDQILHEITSKINIKYNYEFDISSPKVLGAGELGVLINVDGVITVAIHLRLQKRIQLMLWPENNAERFWVGNHFEMLNADPLRADLRFYPQIWRNGNYPGMTKDIDEAVRRFGVLVDIIRVRNNEEIQRKTYLHEYLVFLD